MPSRSRLSLCILVMAALAATAAMEGASSRPRSREELQVVDCLLPGQLRKLGRQQTYLSQRRPVRTTALDCEIRGGEYVAHDRANYQTALKVWLAAAEGGDPQAQYYVGEIYEKGLGTPPDYARAAEWYLKAAEKGHAQSQINLGFLHEKGLGVQQDPRAALEWYRKASGLSGSIVLDSEMEAIRKELSDANARVQTAEERTRSLEGQLQTARQAVETEKSSGRRATEATASLEQEVGKLQRTLEEERRQLAGLRKSRAKYDMAGPTIEIVDRSAVRSPSATAAREDDEVVGRVEAPAGLSALRVDGAPQPVDKSGFFRFKPRSRRMTILAVDMQGKEGQLVHDLDARSDPSRSGGPSGRSGAKFGAYHALIVGNSDYASLPRVETAEKDVTALAGLLEKQFAFQVTVLRNATYLDLLSAFSDLKERLGEKDNLLVYYAGHGEMDAVSGVGYWLPVDAEKDVKSSWMSSREISEHLSMLPARHVLIIADSCYSGALTRSSLARLDAPAGSERDRRIGDLVAKRSRTALTSGGLKPVLDTGGAGHSIFARAVLEALSRATTPLETYGLWSKVKAQVMLETQSLRFEQVPEYAPIQYAGHESGEFFFVPARG